MLCRRHHRFPALFASFTPTIARARQYGIFRAETVAALNALFDEVGKGKYASTADLKQLSATAQRERIVFGIKGNDYRLVVSVHFEKGIVWIILRQSAGRLDREPVPHLPRRIGLRARVEDGRSGGGLCFATGSSRSSKRAVSRSGGTARSPRRRPMRNAARATTPETDLRVWTSPADPHWPDSRPTRHGRLSRPCPHR